MGEWITFLWHEYDIYPQDEMGLDQDELDQRFETVSARISKVTAEMVDCDTKNRDKIKKKCETQRLRIEELAVKLRLANSGSPCTYYLDIAPMSVLLLKSF